MIRLSPTGPDPAFALGTGTPVWGGLTSIQASILLRDIAGINMVGGDVVEVSPPYDTTGATAIFRGACGDRVDLPVGLDPAKRERLTMTRKEQGL